MKAVFLSFLFVSSVAFGEGEGVFRGIRPACIPEVEIATLVLNPSVYSCIDRVMQMSESTKDGVPRIAAAEKTLTSSIIVYTIDLRIQNGRPSLVDAVKATLKVQKGLRDGEVTSCEITSGPTELGQ